MQQLWDKVGYLPQNVGEDDHHVEDDSEDVDAGESTEEQSNEENGSPITNLDTVLETEFLDDEFNNDESEVSVTERQDNKPEDREQHDSSACSSVSSQS